MGSLVTFGEIITKQTGIPTRVVGRVDTVMVMCKLLQIKGNIKEEYAMSIYKREMMGGTMFVGNISGMWYRNSNFNSCLQKGGGFSKG